MTYRLRVRATTTKEDNRLDSRCYETCSQCDANASHTCDDGDTDEAGRGVGRAGGYNLQRRGESSGSVAIAVLREPIGNLPFASNPGTAGS